MSRAKKFTLVTTVSVAKSGTNSLRVTIPEAIVAYLKLEAGNKINWTMENQGKIRWSELTPVNKDAQRSRS